MSLQDPPAKPTEYGLCVRDSEIMAITNRTKMRHAKQMNFLQSQHTSILHFQERINQLKLMKIYLTLF